MAKLYSIYATISERYSSVRKDLYFVGVFDEKGLERGVKEFMFRMERSILPPEFSDETVQTIVEDELSGELLVDTLHNPDSIFNIIGTCYRFYLNETECNEVKDVRMMYLLNEEIQYSEGNEEEFDDSAAWEDDSDRGCKDCPPSECTGHCMSCFYRPV